MFFVFFCVVSAGLHMGIVGLHSCTTLVVPFLRLVLQIVELSPLQRPWSIQELGIADNSISLQSPHDIIAV